ncbi:MAG TPA: dephospho-CoA kinase [Propionibacteriaceae bacterium]|jgi:dephospho-CoA kinase
MVRVGVTGGIASGKTAVSDRLGQLGAVVIDADLLAREVVEPGTPGLTAVVERFGEEVLDQGVLDRAALGRVVFSDPAARRDLEHIIHPAVRARAARIEASAPSDAVVVHVIPLLVETRQQDDFDVVVVVDVDHELQLARLQRRNALSAPEADARLAAQASRQERLAAADRVIDNSGSLESLHEQVDELWRDLVTEAGGKCSSARGRM